MLAKNPKTGAPIRIMNLETAAWRDQKTLVWLDDVPAALAAAPAERWIRWEIGASSIVAAEALVAASMKPDVVLCLDETPQIHAWLAAGRWRMASLIAIPRRAVTEIGMETLSGYRITNMICLEEIAELYPYVGTPWDGTPEDARVLLALSLRLGRTFPVAAAHGPQPLDPRAAIAAARGLSIGSTLITPPPLWFVTQYYEPDKARRRKEIRACLEANLACPLVDRVVLLNEAAAAAPLPAHPKVDERLVGKRLTYADVLRWIRDEAPADALIAFANADIALDTGSWRLLWSVDMVTTPRFLALLRWEVETLDEAGRAAAKLFGPRPDSQDTWVVAAAAVKAAFAAQTDWSAYDFPFGQAGCDNAITVEMLRKKFQVVNPALNLKTYHYHSSQVRTYDPHNVVDKPAYLYIQPTGLQDMQPLHSPPPPATTTPFKPRPVPRPVGGPLTPAQAATFCTMVSRATKGELQLDPTGQNLWTPPPVKLYTLTDAFQSREGLPFTYNGLLLGGTKAAAEAWSKSQLSSLSASVRSPASAAAPLSNEVAASAPRYVTEYIAKILLMRKLLGLPAAEFWCGRDGGVQEALRLFSWGTAEVPVLSRDDTPQAWCDRLGVWLPQDGPAGLITAEEVEALRESLGLGGGWVPKPAHERIVVMVDGAWITEEAAEALEEAIAPTPLKFLWAGRTNLEATVHALRGASGLIVAGKGGLGSWAWALPAGASVWEVQSEMEPSATVLHLAGAAGLRHRLCIVPKGAASEAERARLVEKLSRDIKEMPKPEGLADIRIPSEVAARPRLLLPAGHAGMYAHAGDSFREMARLWGERGYVQCVEDTTARQVWLHGRGKMLLYDRPNLDWLTAAPAEERSWEHALFGNPAPPAGARAAGPWTFWPRRPRLVEELVAAGVPSANWEARPDLLVFYGRSENATQRRHRTGADWGSVCSRFIHADGESKYPFTQEEYLRKLAAARYALCLAGYGRKCHREVEAMAMGAVPIVAPEVDMESYAEPPVVGTHYFRVKTPEEAAHVVASMTPERWAAMSAACRDWWRRNASAQGSWELTQRLVEAAQRA